MSNETDFVEPEYETPQDAAPGAVPLPRRIVQIFTYGGAAAVMGLAVMVYASPSFAAKVGSAMPSSLVGSAADGEMSACSSGACCSSESAVQMASLDSDCGSCPSMASEQAAASACCSASSGEAMVVSADAGGESSCCSSLSRAAMVAASVSEAESCGSCPSGSACAETAECPSAGCTGSCESEQLITKDAGEAETAGEMTAAELTIPDATEVFAEGL